MRKFLKSVDDHIKNKKDFIKGKSLEINKLLELRDAKELSVKEKDIQFNKTFDENILADIELVKSEISELDKKIGFLKSARDKAENMKFSFDCKNSGTSIDDILQEADLKSRENEIHLAKEAYLEACNKYANSLQYIHQYKVQIRELANMEVIDNETVSCLRSLFGRHFMLYHRPNADLNINELGEVISRIDSLIQDIK
jgi:hypothetical protein